MMSDSVGLFEELHGEIWKSLEDVWDHFSNNDPENFLKYYDQAFKGFRPETPFPVDRAWMDQWVREYLKDVKVSSCRVIPQDIQVYDENLAVVIYGMDFIEDRKGEKQCVSQRHTVVVRRKIKRWAMMTAHIEILDQHFV